jgi:hypothetical protein
MEDAAALVEVFTHGNHAITLAALVIIYKQVARLDSLEAKLRIVLKRLGLE